MSEIKDGGPAILISDCDKEIFKSSEWVIGANGYAYKKGGRVKGKPCLLHRIILNPKNGNEVHHINHNKLDNRRENLQEVTPTEHQAHHVQKLIERNLKSRKYPLTAICAVCKIEFLRNRDHRGRTTCCSRKCGFVYQRGRKKNVKR